MPQKVATFEKVSREEYDKTVKKTLEEFNKRGIMVSDIIFVPYDEIKLPKRSTASSAGYDIYSGMDVTPDKMIKKAMRMPAGTRSLDIVVDYHIMVPTFIKCKIDPDWVLHIYPKSGLATKKRTKLMNTVGIIDADYYGNQSNEGHIMIPLEMYQITNGDGSPNYDDLVIPKNTKLMQGIFLPYGITTDDECTEERTGGFGSTGLS